MRARQAITRFAHIAKHPGKTLYIWHCPLWGVIRPVSNQPCRIAGKRGVYFRYLHRYYNRDNIAIATL